jgi:hypothetical protein
MRTANTGRNKRNSNRKNEKKRWIYILWLFLCCTGLLALLWLFAVTGVAFAAYFKTVVQTFVIGIITTSGTIGTVENSGTSSNVILDVNFPNFTSSASIFSVDNTTQSYDQFVPPLQPITYCDDLLLNGWSHIPCTANYTAIVPGIYLFYCQLEVQPSDVGVNIIVIATLSTYGTGPFDQVMGSQGSVNVFFATQNTQLSTEFMLGVNEGDVLNMNFAADVTGTTISPSDIFTDPTIYTVGARLIATRVG